MGGEEGGNHGMVNGVGWSQEEEVGCWRGCSWIGCNPVGGTLCDAGFMRIQREPSRKIEGKKDEEDGCFPIIQHYRPRFQVLQITENQFRKAEALSLHFRVPSSFHAHVLLFSSVYTYLVAHYAGPFRNYGRGWLHRRGAESFNDFSIASRRWTWTIGKVETISYRE